MDLKLIIIGIIMMLPICLIKFIPALNVFGIGRLIFGLTFCIGMCILLAGISKFENVERFGNVEKEEEDEE